MGHGEGCCHKNVKKCQVLFEWDKSKIHHILAAQHKCDLNKKEASFFFYMIKVLLSLMFFAKHGALLI